MTADNPLLLVGYMPMAPSNLGSQSAVSPRLGTEEEQLALVPLLDLFNNRGMAREGDVYARKTGS